MIFKEEVKDLFTVPSDYYLAQCISSDLGMGKGIAVEFNKRFDMKNKMLARFPDGFTDPDGCYEIGCELVDNVFNLITKHRYFQKPTYGSMEQALYFMKVEVEYRGIHKIAMPIIGCDLDRLEWDKVRELIMKTFDGVDVEILVCHKPALL